MARMALSIVGNAVGSYFGGPIGGWIGSQAGNFVGGMIDDAIFGKDSGKGVKSSDVMVQIDTYGHPIYKVWSSMVVAGDLMWVSKRRKKEKKTSSKGGYGGSGGSYTVYRQDFMVGLCEGEPAVCDILKVWFDAKLVYDKTGKSGSKQRYSSMKLRFYFGGANQGPDELIEAERGIGRVPGFRHLCAIMVENLPLRDYGNHIPNVRALVVTHCTSNPTVDVIRDFSTGFSVIDSLMLDPRTGSTQLYFPAQATPNGDFFEPGKLDVIDGQAAVTTNEWAVANHWGSNGHPDISIDGKIAWMQKHHSYSLSYWIKNDDAVAEQHQIGSDLTLSIQTMGLFAAPAMTPGGPPLFQATTYAGGDLEVAAACTKLPRQVPSGSFHYARGGAEYLWFWGQGTLINGDIWAFWVDGLEMEQQFTLRRQDFGALGGFFSGPFRLQTIETDDAGVAYILWSDTTQTRLYRVAPPTPKHLCAGTLPGAPAIDLVPGIDDILSEVFPGAHVMLYYAPDNSLIIGRENVTPGLIKWSLTEEAIVATNPLQFQANIASFNNARRLKQDSLWIGTTVFDDTVSPGANGYRIFPKFTEIDLLTLTTKRDETWYQAGVHYPLRNHNIFSPINALYDKESDTIFSEAAGSMDVGKFSFGTIGACMPLQTVVEEICVATKKLTLAQIDATALADDRVCGFVNDQQRPARELLEVLAGLYFFNAREHDGKIQFLKRTGAPVVTIPVSDLDAHEEGDSANGVALKEVRQQEIELPRDVQMLFINPDRDYEQDSVQELRNARVVETTERITVNAPVAFSQGEARRICNIYARERWMQRSTYEAVLPPPYLRLDVLDVSEVQLDDGSSRIIRWSEITEGANGLLEIKGVDHHPTIYTDLPEIAGAPGGGFVGGIIGSIALTVLFLMDTPLLHDSDDGPVLYFGGTPQNQEGNWGGFELLRSINQGVTWDEFSEQAVSAVAGYTLTVLGVPEAWTLWDTVNTVDVQLLAGELFSASESDVLSLANAVLVGDEIIQFTTATLLSSETRRHRLSGFLRGRRGTEWAIGTHQTSEQFVLLNIDGIKKVTLPLSDYQVRRDYRAITAELTIEDSSLVVLTWQARSLKPYAVAQPQVTHTETDDILISWNRRSRIGVAWQSGTDPDIAEATEAYEVDVLSGTTIKHTLMTSTPSVLYTAAQQIADGVSVNSAVTFAIYQMSATVGRGFVTLIANVGSAIVTPPPLIIPDAPTISVATISSTEIDVTITPADPLGFNSIRVDISLNGTSWAQAGPNLGPIDTVFHATGLTPATPYYFRARVFNSTSQSPWSNTDSDTTDAAPGIAPSAPILLSVEAVSSSRIDGGFTDASGNETSFEVHRSVNGGAFTLRFTLLPNVTTFSDTGLTASTLYAYKVLAKNSFGSSAFSNTDSDTTDPIIIVSPGTFFVDPVAGNNSSTTGNISFPYRTIARGLQAVGAGGTVYLRGSGTYTERISNPPSGTSWTNAVTIAAYPGDTVILQAINTSAILALTYAGSPIQYIIFDGLIVNGANLSKFAVNCDGTVWGTNNINHIRFRNVEVKNSLWSGVLTGRGVNFLEFIGGKYHDNGSNNGDHGIYLESSDCLIEGGEFYNNVGFGIHIFNGYTNIPAARNNRNVVRRTRSHDNDKGMVLGSGDNNLAYNNLLYDNTIDGVQIGYGCTNTKFYLNTVYSNGGSGIQVRSNIPSTILKNNIAYNNGTDIQDLGSGTTKTNNHLTANGNPLFVNAGAGNFSLQSGSPCIDAGAPLPAITDDFDGNPRPVNGVYDIGACEKQ